MEIVVAGLVLLSLLFIAMLVALVAMREALRTLRRDVSRDTRQLVDKTLTLEGQLASWRAVTDEQHRLREEAAAHHELRVQDQREHTRDALADVTKAHTELVEKLNQLLEGKHTHVLPIVARERVSGVPYNVYRCRGGCDLTLQLQVPE